MVIKIYINLIISPSSRTTLHSVVVTPTAWRGGGGGVLRFRFENEGEVQRPFSDLKFAAWDFVSVRNSLVNFFSTKIFWGLIKRCPAIQSFLI